MYGPPVPFGDLHVTEAFECGEEALNVYLKRYAGQNEKRHYVTHPSMKWSRYNVTNT